MTQTIGYPQVCRMLTAATEQIRAQHEMLSRLDSAVGDGDHGTTILRTMEAVSRTVAESTDKNLRLLFASVAWAVLSADGGSTGPLLGSFFQGMSEGSPPSDTLDTATLAAVFESGVAKMHKRSKAQIGDKTMMDAFLPAVASLKSADPAKGIQDALQHAAAAAAQGAEATRHMRARFGRARNLGDRVIGHPDPGAVSISLLFKGFSEAL